VSLTFRHGVHPPEAKSATAGRPIERMPFVDEYVIPLNQHIGAPSKALVTPGEDVRRGQPIAEPGGFVSVAQHAPVTGTVRSVGLKLDAAGRMVESIVVAADPYDAQRFEGTGPLDFESLPRDEVVRAIQAGGMVGLGGAAFPSHVKLSIPEGKVVRTLVINGCECEPYLTCDHRVMAERPEAVVRGTRIMMSVLGVQKAWIGVELNKPDAIAALQAVAPPDVEVVGLEVKYPQGAEKMLIEAIFGEQVPQGGLPLDLGVLCNNVGTAAALADLFDRGLPLIERVVTVTGPGVARPKNLLVPVGTPLQAVIDACGGLVDAKSAVILGGPMMGRPQKSLNVPLLKGTSGILCLDGAGRGGHVEHPCIRCGRCLDACPLFLNPARLARLARAERPDQLEALSLMSCFECASCSYVCPSAIPLVQWMRVGKAIVRARRAADS